jgi:general secretion pathway protein G
MRRSGGFTLIELVVTLALVGLMAYIATPLYEVTMTRVREAELRSALRQIRVAIDAYKTAADSGVIAKRATETGYPGSLEVLVKGVERLHDVRGGRVVFLRQLPRDPFSPDPAAPAARHWETRSYGSAVDDPQPGVDVFDVTSRSSRIGLNGIPYREW